MENHEFIKVFEWRDEYKTNLENIDSQHSYLIGILNDFSNSFYSKTLTKNEFDSAVFKLLDYTNYHFKNEEILMEKYKLSPEFINLHKQSHKAFLEKVYEMLDKLKDELDENLAKNMIEFLISWLVYHILGEDHSMARQINLISEGVEANTAYETSKKEGEKEHKRLLESLGMLEIVKNL